MTLRRKLRRIGLRSKRLFSRVFSRRRDRHPSCLRDALDQEERRRRWMLPIGRALVLLFGVGLAWQASHVKRR